MNWFFIICVSATLNLVVFMTSAQSEMFIFPTDGQSAEQQEQDEFACYKWAKNQTGVDPNQPTQSAASPPPSRRGGGDGEGEMISQLQARALLVVEGFESVRQHGEGVAVWPRLTYRIPDTQ